MGKIVLTIIFCMTLVSLSYAQAQIEIKDAWVRETPPGSSVTALYMSIGNSGNEDDTLKGVSVGVSKSAEIHVTSVDSGGVATMEMMKSVDVPARKSVLFEPGGMHIMLIDLAEPLKSGDIVEIDLQFEKAGRIKAHAEVVGIKDMTEEHHHH